MQGHATDAVCSTTRFGIVLGISCVFFISELVGEFWSGDGIDFGLTCGGIQWD